MGLMKKDMGGAANTIALAQMIMSAKLDVRLRLLVPAVENSISAGAFRPGDILMSRKGLTVEIFWTPYEGMIEPGIADIDNAPSGGFAGSITAALFLKRFVENAKEFAHFDIFGWTPAAKPARPKGGACQGARAIFEALDAEYGG